MRKRFTQEFKQDAVSQVIGIWRRWTVVGLMPVCFAIARTLQCVASRGVLSNLWATTRSTSSSLILHGAPGRGSPQNPLRPRSMDRWRISPPTVWIRPDSRLRRFSARPTRRAERCERESPGRAPSYAEASTLRGIFARSGKRSVVPSAVQSPCCPY